MKKHLGIENIKKYVFMTENTYLLHLGEHNEEKILLAEKEMNPVIRIINVNESTSAIPLERALFLLEKYYKLAKKTPLKLDEQEAAPPRTTISKEMHPDRNKEITTPKAKDSRKSLAGSV